MDLQPIGQVSKQFNISIRTLRYYEEIGLITAVKKEDSAYRLYDEYSIIRLRQIVILRKLRIPLKQIAEMLKDNETKVAIDILECNLSEIYDEINALSNISQIITSLIERLNLDNENFAFFDDKNLLESVNSITVSNLKFKEEYTMEILNKAGEKLNRLTDRDVRIIYLPPATVASIHHIGCTNSEIPESTTGIMMREFIKNNNLAKIKPDLRHYGLNHPDKPHNSEEHGYERLVTIPESMDVPEPFVKKQFLGGLYAAYTITGEDWEECPLLWEWVKNSKKYEFNLGTPECMTNGLEEYLNHINLNISSEKYYSEVWQIDILIPVKEK